LDRCFLVRCIAWFGRVQFESNSILTGVIFFILILICSISVKIENK
jgi:hypothetical protein